MNILNIINDKFLLNSEKELIFFNAQRNLDNKNRVVLPSKIKNLFNSNEILSIKTIEPYQHIILLPYQDEIKKIVSSLDMSYSNTLIKNPISSIKIDSSSRIIMPQECLREGDKLVYIIGEKYRIHIFSESIYKIFCKQETTL